MQTFDCRRRMWVVTSNKPTRIWRKSDGTQISTCIDHIFTNAAELCSKAVSVPVGCSDHNLVAIVRKTKVPKPGPKVIFERSYKMFNQDNFIEDVKNVRWSNVLSEKDPEKALGKFWEIFMPLVEKHAPLRKFTVRNVRTPWLANELKKYMAERNQAKINSK